MPFRRVATTSDIPAGTTKNFVINDREILICNVGGEFYAIDNICSHDDGPLGGGALIDCEIECPRHGARFDVRSGNPITPPAFLPVDVFQTRTVETDLEIDI